MRAEYGTSVSLRLTLLAASAAAVLVVAGCGGGASQIPESASLAPADAVGFATVTTDSESSQWQKANDVLARIPALRETSAMIGSSA